MTSTSQSISLTETRTHSVSDQITQIAGNAATHDAKGNLTDYEINIKTYEVEYDLDNRIIKVDVDNNDVEYRYDALGRRVIRKEGSDKTALLWWGNSECAEYEHGAGQSCIQNDIMSHPSSLNSVIARAVDGSKFDLEWYHKNYLDHVYAVSDDTGNLDEHYRYTAFGEVTIYNGTGTIKTSTQINNTIMWNTRRLDTVSGYYLYKYRHYDPQLGRWPSRDPIGEKGGVNLYAFVGNNPVFYWDELGEDRRSLFLKLLIELSIVSTPTPVNSPLPIPTNSGSMPPVTLSPANTAPGLTPGGGGRGFTYSFGPLSNSGGVGGSTGANPLTWRPNGGSSNLPRIAGRSAAALGILLEVYRVCEAPNGDRLSEAGNGVLRLGGGWAGAQIGAAIGTMLFPGAGTVIGGLIGGGLGYAGTSALLNNSGGPSIARGISATQYRILENNINSKPCNKCHENQRLEFNFRIIPNHGSSLPGQQVPHMPQGIFPLGLAPNGGPI